MTPAPYDDVRIWQTHLSVPNAHIHLPVPEMIVEEEQKTPAYRWDGKKRSEEGAQMVITLSGEGRLALAGKEHVLSAGKAFLHNHNDPDVCYYYPPGGLRPWRFLWFAFYGADLPGLITETNSTLGYLFDVPLEGELIHLLKEHKNYSGVIRLLQPFEGAELIFRALALLCSSRNGTPQDPRSFIVSETENLIAADPAAELQVEKLAARFHLSREHLSRLFQQETGVSLHEYIIRFRLKLALDLLRRSRLSLKEISGRCGWNDYSNFYRIFVKRFNCSPQDFRRGNNSSAARQR